MKTSMVFFEFLIAIEWRMSASLSMESRSLVARFTHLRRYVFLALGRINRLSISFCDMVEIFD